METVVDEDGIEKRNNPQLENPLTVEYLDNKTLQIQYLYAYTASLKRAIISLRKLKTDLKLLIISKRFPPPSPFHIVLKTTV